MTEPENFVNIVIKQMPDPEPGHHLVKVTKGKIRVLIPHETEEQLTVALCRVLTMLGLDETNIPYTSMGKGDTMQEAKESLEKNMKSENDKPPKKPKPKAVKKKNKKDT